MCSRLRRPVGTILRCEEQTSPYLKTCNLTCARGFASTTVFPQYTCGEETGHLWNGQIDHASPVILPSCSSTAIFIFSLFLCVLFLVFWLLFLFVVAFLVVVGGRGSGGGKAFHIGFCLVCQFAMLRWDQKAYLIFSLALTESDRF